METPSACKVNLILPKVRKERKSLQKEQLSVNMLDSNSDWREHLANNDAWMNAKGEIFTDMDEEKSTKCSNLKVATKVTFDNVEMDFPTDSKNSELGKLKARKMSNPYECIFVGSDVAYFVKESLLTVTVVYQASSQWWTV